eukprot:11257708-Ditylum_brightwellii.AAC.1
MHLPPKHSNNQPPLRHQHPAPKRQGHHSSIGFEEMYDKLQIASADLQSTLHQIEELDLDVKGKKA